MSEDIYIAKEVSQKIQIVNKLKNLSQKTIQHQKQKIKHLKYIQK